MRTRTFLSFSLLFIFISVKGLSYHPLTHSGEDKQAQCELCDFVLLNELTPIFLPGYTTVEAPAFQIPIKETATAVIQAHLDDSMKASHFCRPPPSLS